MLATLQFSSQGDYFERHSLSPCEFQQFYIRVLLDKCHLPSVTYYFSVCQLVLSSCSLEPLSNILATFSRCRIGKRKIPDVSGHRTSLAAMTDRMNPFNLPVFLHQSPIDTLDSTIIVTDSHSCSASDLSDNFKCIRIYEFTTY